MLMQKQKMKQMLDGIAAAHSVDVEFTYQHGYPPTINHEKEANFAREIAIDVTGQESVNQEQTMGSEDFSFYLQELPGAYAWVGNGVLGESAHLHNPHYNFNDDILPVGASFFVRLVETALAKP